MEDIKDKLLKLKALAQDQANPHESAVAQRLLEKLASKAGISLEQLDLDQEERKFCDKFGFTSVKVDANDTGTTVTIEADHGNMSDAIAYSLYEIFRQRKLKRAKLAEPQLGITDQKKT